MEFEVQRTWSESYLWSASNAIFDSSASPKMFINSHCRASCLTAHPNLSSRDQMSNREAMFMEFLRAVRSCK